jgi:hypothetical protein
VSAFKTGVLYGIGEAEMQTNFTCASPSKDWDRRERGAAVTEARSLETGPSESELHRLPARPVHACVEGRHQISRPPRRQHQARPREGGERARRGVTVRILPRLEPRSDCKPGEAQRPRPQHRMPVGKSSLGLPAPARLHRGLVDAEDVAVWPRVEPLENWRRVMRMLIAARFGRTFGCE